jgi:glycine/D-amino acid oxidase-like deaminating enzyme
MTRRPHEHKGENSFNLVCAGGPDKVLPNGAEYSREMMCSEDMKMLIDDFLRENYAKYPQEGSEYAFCWHGLMGYTPNGIRRIGPEPVNPTLLYNLGCNGVGILPSVYGGKKISQFINGENMPKSIFDPVDQRLRD